MKIFYTICALLFIFYSCKTSRITLNGLKGSPGDIILKYSGNKILISSTDLSEYKFDHIYHDSIAQVGLKKLLSLKNNNNDTISILLQDNEYIVDNDTLEYYFNTMIFSVLESGKGIILPTNGNNKQKYLLKKIVYDHCKGSRYKISKSINLIDPKSKTILANKYIWRKIVNCL